MPLLSDEIIEYQSRVIAGNNDLLQSIIVLIRYDRRGIPKQRLMKELDRSQIPIEKILSKFEGMLIVDDNMEGKSYGYTLNKNGQNLVKNLINKNILIIDNERGIMRNGDV